MLRSGICRFRAAARGPTRSDASERSQSSRSSINRAASSSGPARIYSASVLTAIGLEYRPAAGVPETTRPVLARENLMRRSHIRRTIALAAAVSATTLAGAGPAAAHTPVDDPSQYGEWIAAVERPA